MSFVAARTRINTPPMYAFGIGGIYRPEYSDALDYATKNNIDIPSLTERNRDSLWVGKMVDAGIWSGLDVMYKFTSDAERFGLINLKSPTTLLASGGTFIWNVGQFASSQITTGFIPSANWTLNDAGWFHVIDIPNVRVSTNILTGGGITNLFANTFPSGSQYFYQWSMNDATNRNAVIIQSVIPFENKLVFIQRTASNSSRIMFDGVQIATSAVASVAVPLTALNLANAHTIPAPSGLIYKMLGAGASLTGREADLLRIWNEYYYSK